MHAYRQTECDSFPNSTRFVICGHVLQTQKLGYSFRVSHRARREGSTLKGPNLLVEIVF